MSSRSIIHSLGYLFVGLFSVGFAFFLSLQFIAKLRAQGSDAPPTATADSAVGQGDPGAEGKKSVTDLEGFLEPFIYDVVNRRDPFLPYSEYLPPDATGPVRPMSPAQRFELDQLSLVGIMWDVKEPRAMFMDPNKEVLVLGRDEGIGNRNGYIATIREGEVVVVEAIRRRGDIIYKTRILRIER